MNPIPVLKNHKRFHMIKNTLFIILLIVNILPGSLVAQHLAAFSDIQNHFYVFDAGKTEQLENLKIQSYKVGGNHLAYIDNAGGLKVYYNGEVYELDNAGAGMRYYATDYLLGYKYLDFLKVFDRGKIKILCTAVEGYVVQDSLITWYDRISRTVNIYYKGKTETLEDGLLDFPFERLKSGDNTLAYVTTVDNKFKVFWAGDIWVIDEFGEYITYKTGKNIVAYMDEPRNIFKVFYKGEVFELEYYRPQAFEVGDDMVVYVDDMGNLKSFNKGITTTLLPNRPEHFEVNDEAMIFIDQGYFKTHCNGTVQIIERYVPDKYVLDWNSISYIDDNQNVQVVQNCEKHVVTYELVTDLEMNRNLIMYKTGPNTTRIYYFGQVFEE